jgi:hypothetical protein
MESQPKVERISASWRCPACGCDCPHRHCRESLDRFNPERRCTGRADDIRDRVIFVHAKWKHGSSAIPTNGIRYVARTRNLDGARDDTLPGSCWPTNGLLLDMNRSVSCSSCGERDESYVVYLKELLRAAGTLKTPVSRWHVAGICLSYLIGAVVTGGVVDFVLGTAFFFPIAAAIGLAVSVRKSFVHLQMERGETWEAMQGQRTLDFLETGEPTKFEQIWTEMEPHSR